MNNEAKYSANHPCNGFPHERHNRLWWGKRAVSLLGKKIEGKKSKLTAANEGKDALAASARLSLIGTRSAGVVEEDGIKWREDKSAGHWRPSALSLLLHLPAAPQQERTVRLFQVDKEHAWQFLRCHSVRRGIHFLWAQTDKCWAEASKLQF